MDSTETIESLHEAHYHAIETRRLYLRRLSANDAEMMFSYTSCADNFRFLKRNAHLSVSEDLAFLNRVEESMRNHSDFIWGICVKDTNALIGTCRLFHIDLSDRRGEVSYLMHQDHQGNGYATEAIQAVIQYAFRELDFIRVQARCAAENTASERVMQKCGMQFEGTLRKYAYVHGEWKDMKVYSVLRS